MARGGADAAVVRFWRAVEMLSPPSIGDEPSWENRVFQLRPGEAPPWHPAHPLARVALKPGTVWRHTVYAGVFELERLRDVVVGVFGEDPRYRDGRLSGRTAVFSVTLNTSGRLVRRSEVLSACAWSTGRVLARRPWRGGWLDGREWNHASAAFGEVCRGLGEPPPVPLAAAGGGIAGSGEPRANDDTVLIAADSPGAPADGAATPDRRRPLTPDDLFDLLADQVEALGVREALRPTEIWVASRQVSNAKAEESDSDFLNSFLDEDLDRAQDALARGEGGAALTTYLRPAERIDVAGRVDIRTDWTVALGAAAPDLTPRGRWVTDAERPLALSQQFAVNQIVNGTVDDGVPVFAVNGPPGTGKTTMLRDVIAALVVERARQLALLPRPESAYAGVVQTWSTEQGKRKIMALKPELTGFEMVVASANNGAVQNITHEFPGPDGIDAPWREAARDVDYFAEAASILLEIETAPPEARAWAGVAAALGNMRLRRKFRERFWWGVTAAEETAAERDRKAGRPRAAERSMAGLADLLTAQRNAPPIDWSAVVQRFTAAVAALDELVAERRAAAEAAELLAVADAEIEQLRVVSLGAVREASALERRYLVAADAVRRAETDVREATAARTAHAVSQPRLSTNLATRGKAGREWHERDAELASAIVAAEGRLAAERRAADELRRAADAGRKQKSAAEQRLADVEDRVSEAEQTWQRAFERWGGHVPTVDAFEDDASREMAAPWNDPEIAAARTTVFLEALRLHKHFLFATAATSRSNLQAAMDIIGGQAPPNIPAATAKAAWQTLFLAVPVVSTTFASFGRLFTHLRTGDLGWVFVDEAGQATPAGAVGGLWRARRAVIVGDPRQLEPVVTVPHSLQQALREHFEVPEEWLPDRASVQTIADRLAPYGTYLDADGDDNDDGRVWVGAPLRVHRRSDQPMFGISNDIAYGGTLMVYGKQPVEPDQDRYAEIPSTRWIHVEGAAEGDSAWIPAEGEAVRALIKGLRDAGVEAARIRIISPFRKVVQGVLDLELGLPAGAVGTIHTMQGKEADIVILVLGGGNGGQLDWAAEKPNLLNVAVSRAKRRLYVVGDRERWRQKRYFHRLALSLPVENGTGTP